MIVTAGSLTRYEVLTRPGESSGKVCAAPHTAGTIRYNRSSTSGWRSRNRHPCSQSTRSRGWLMQGSNRIVNTRSRAASVPLVSARRDPPVTVCIRWALAGKLPVAPRAVCHGPDICLASGCPVGTFDNSPVIHRWVPGPSPGFSPVGTAEAFAPRDVRRLHFSRPYGTEGLVLALFPSDKSLGYSHKVPTGQCPRCAVKTDPPTLRIRLVSEPNASLTFEKEKPSCTDL